MLNYPISLLVLSSIIFKYKNKLIGKKIRFVVTRGRGWGEGKLDEVGQKV